MVPEAAVWGQRDEQELRSSRPSATPRARGLETPPPAPDAFPGGREQLETALCCTPSRFPRFVVCGARMSRLCVPGSSDSRPFGQMGGREVSLEGLLKHPACLDATSMFESTQASPLRREVLGDVFPCLWVLESGPHLLKLWLAVEVIFVSRSTSHALP